MRVTVWTMVAWGCLPEAQRETADESPATANCTVSVFYGDDLYNEVTYDEHGNFVLSRSPTETGWDTSTMAYSTENQILSLVHAGPLRRLHQTLVLRRVRRGDRHRDRTRRLRHDRHHDVLRSESQMGPDRLRR